jgi:hypothetical protein
MVIYRVESIDYVLCRNSVSQDVMGGLKVERFLDFGVRGEVEVEEDEDGEDEPF